MNVPVGAEQSRARISSGRGCPVLAVCPGEFGVWGLLRAWPLAQSSVYWGQCPVQRLREVMSNQQSLGQCPVERLGSAQFGSAQLRGISRMNPGSDAHCPGTDWR